MCVWSERYTHFSHFFFPRWGQLCLHCVPAVSLPYSEGHFCSCCSLLPFWTLPLNVFSLCPLVSFPLAGACYPLSLCGVGIEWIPFSHHCSLSASASLRLNNPSSLILSSHVVLSRPWLFLCFPLIFLIDLNCYSLVSTNSPSPVAPLWSIAQRDHLV